MYDETENEIKQELLKSLLPSQMTGKSRYEYGYIFVAHCHDLEKAIKKAQDTLDELFLKRPKSYPAMTVHHENGYVYYFLVPKGYLKECPNKIDDFELNVEIIKERTLH